MLVKKYRRDLSNPEPHLQRHNPVFDWTQNTITFGSSYCHAHCLPTRIPRPTNTMVTPYKIAMIFCAAFRLATQQEDCLVFHLAMSTIQEPTVPVKRPDYSANLVLPHYDEFLPLFTKKGTDKLLPYRYVDHEIPLEAVKKSTYGSPVLYIN